MERPEEIITQAGFAVEIVLCTTSILQDSVLLQQKESV